MKSENVPSYKDNYVVTMPQNSPKNTCLHTTNYLQKNAVTPEETAVSELGTWALFFAMRSCEYTHTSGNPFSGERKTKLLRVRKNWFFKKTKELSKTIDNLLELVVQITFKF